VLDACCGNGGKTLALASSLSARESQNPGCLDAGYRIDCFDVDKRRLRHLVAATRRAGCENVTRVVTKLDLRAVAAANVEANKYDAVLVDAPCSSAGALRRFPSLRWEMEEFKTRLDVWDDADLDERGSEDVKDRRISDSGRFYDDSEDFSDGHDAIDGDVASASGRSDRTLTRSFPATQRRILRDAAALVRAGGVLVYATCSVLRSENEDVASWFEDAFAETFEPFAFPAGWPAADAENASSTSSTKTTHVVGLTPDAHGTDGFFIARWRRKR
jgi:16S rRNA C967 or C1407 C5-methylase (RsmB/RsmF family)